MSADTNSKAIAADGADSSYCGNSGLLIVGAAGIVAILIASALTFWLFPIVGPAVGFDFVVPDGPSKWWLVACEAGIVSGTVLMFVGMPKLAPVVGFDIPGDEDQTGMRSCGVFDLAPHLAQVESRSTLNGG